MGIPAIVTDINGCNEIILDSLNGVIIPTKCVESILFKMELLYKDVQFYNSLKINARNVIMSKFEQTFFWQQLLFEYEFQENRLNAT